MLKIVTTFLLTLIACATCASIFADDYVSMATGILAMRTQRIDASVLAPVDVPPKPFGELDPQSHSFVNFASNALRQASKKSQDCKCIIENGKCICIETGKDCNDENCRVVDLSQVAMNASNTATVKKANLPMRGGCANGSCSTQPGTRQVYTYQEYQSGGCASGSCNSGNGNYSSNTTMHYQSSPRRGLFARMRARRG